MRRSDREVTDAQKIAEVFAEAEVIHLGLNDGGRVYIVPLNYGYEENEGQYTIYCHSAGEGRKIDLIGAGADVGFALECGVQIFSGPTACEYGTHYRSIIGEGRATLVNDLDERKKAMGVVMNHYTGKSDWAFNDKWLNAMQVIRIDVDALSCKING